MSSKAKILYVEDDMTLSFVTRDNLEMRGYWVEHCEDGLDALQRIRSGVFDLCLLDVMLPKMDGFELATRIRQLNEQIPILFLTARSGKEDRIFGLQKGADDYITKPFSIEELILKIEVFLRRSKVNGSNHTVERTIRFGDSKLDVANQQLQTGGQTMELTQREALLLEFLINNQNQVLKREDILNAIWGNDQFFSSRTMDVFISRLRKLLKDEPQVRIDSVHNVGYRFVVENSRRLSQ